MQCGAVCIVYIGCLVCIVCIVCKVCIVCVVCISCYVHYVDAFIRCCRSSSSGMLSQVTVDRPYSTQGRKEGRIIVESTYGSKAHSVALAVSFLSFSVYALQLMTVRP